MLARTLMLIGQLPGLRAANAPAPHAMRAQFNANSRFNCVPRLGDITQPALVVHGRTDPIVSLQLSEEMHRGIPDSRMSVFDGGHRITLETGPREQVCAVVLPFLAARG
jgi:pimeloyl-ACP methyl ester carboxylesterase